MNIQYRSIIHIWKEKFALRINFLLDSLNFLLLSFKNNYYLCTFFVLEIGWFIFHVNVFTTHHVILCSQTYNPYAFKVPWYAHDIVNSLFFYLRKFTSAWLQISTITKLTQNSIAQMSTFPLAHNGLHLTSYFVRVFNYSDPIIQCAQREHA